MKKIILILMILKSSVSLCGNVVPKILQTEITFENGSAKISCNNKNECKAYFKEGEKKLDLGIKFFSKLQPIFLDDFRIYSTYDGFRIKHFVLEIGTSCKSEKMHHCFWSVLIRDGKITSAPQLSDANLVFKTVYDVDKKAN